MRLLSNLTHINKRIDGKAHRQKAASPPREGCIRNTNMFVLEWEVCDPNFLDENKRLVFITCEKGVCDLGERTKHGSVEFATGREQYSLTETTEWFQSRTRSTVSA